MSTFIKTNSGIGPGLVNYGNTCYLNSSLQCLLYTPILSQLIQKDFHSQNCSINKFCALCSFQELYQEAFRSNAQKVIKPSQIAKNINLLSKRFKKGRQEDAHEFIRILVEHFQKACIQKNDNKKPITIFQQMSEKTQINKIFAGQLKSQIKCSRCQYKSEVFETFYDLSLDIRNFESINQSLDVFFKKEELRGDNQYNCQKCQKKVNASKQFLINTCPKILTIHLKRFTNELRKVTKKIQFPLIFSTNKYVQDQPPVNYELYAVLIHQGSSIFNGHYYCFVKNNNEWYQMNDESVRKTNVKYVQSENPYILFYKQIDNKNQKSQENSDNNQLQENGKQAIISKKQETFQNGVQQKNGKKIFENIENNKNNIIKNGWTHPKNIIKNDKPMTENNIIKLTSENLSKVIDKQNTEFKLQKNQKQIKLDKNTSNQVQSQSKDSEKQQIKKSPLWQKVEKISENLLPFQKPSLKKSQSLVEENNNRPLQLKKSNSYNEENSNKSLQLKKSNSYENFSFPVYEDKTRFTRIGKKRKIKEFLTNIKLSFNKKVKQNKIQNQKEKDQKQQKMPNFTSQHSINILQGQPDLQKYTQIQELFS